MTDPLSVDLTCPDCGIEPWSIVEKSSVVHEDFYVRNELWDAVCPDDECERWTTRNGEEAGEGTFIICIGCFERRLGRQLRRGDFAAPPRDLFGDAPSRRFVDRWERQD